MNSNSDGHNRPARPHSGFNFGPTDGSLPNAEIDNFNEISGSSPTGPGSFPPPAGMGSSSPIGTPCLNPRGGWAPSDNQFLPPLDDGGFSQGLSIGVGLGGFDRLISVLPPLGPVTRYPSHSDAPERTYRASSVGPGDMGMGSGVGSLPEMPHRPGGRVKVKFRQLGQAHSGISVAKALNEERLSQTHGYTTRDFAPDTLGDIILKVRWSGYRSNLYYIPLSTDRDDYVNLAKLARSTARAIIHFMQAHGILLSMDRVVIRRLEETRPGIWIPVLVTHQQQT